MESTGAFWVPPKPAGNVRGREIIVSGLYAGYRMLAGGRIRPRSSQKEATCAHRSPLNVRKVKSPPTPPFWTRKHFFPGACNEAPGGAIVPREWLRGRAAGVTAGALSRGRISGSASGPEHVSHPRAQTRAAGGLCGAYGGAGCWPLASPGRRLGGFRGAGPKTREARIWMRDRGGCRRAPSSLSLWAARPGCLKNLDALRLQGGGWIWRETRYRY